jgi:uncharacterized membrane protein
MSNLHKILSKPNYLIFGLSLLGLAVSSYLAYEYLLSGPIGCPIGGSGCEMVRLSSFSNFFGVSVPLLGVAYYLVIAALTILILDQKKPIFTRALFFWSAGGFLFSVYLTSLEAFIIKAYCFWCLTSAIIATTIFVLTAARYKIRNK